MASELNFDSTKPAKFKPRARLLLQLGDQLIKNESIALVELVKNAYDADSSIVNIYMNRVDDPINGSIIIDDDGYGMDSFIIENVWLEPGSDFKSEKFKNKEVSPKFKRLPIGEKGIGRFGVHKLGNIIELTTRKANCKEVFVKIDWTDFNNFKYLDQVPITITERIKPLIFKGDKTGTKIIIKNLRKSWERGIARTVKRSINALVSPFNTLDSFKANFDIIDKPGWFEGLLQWNEISHYSLFYFDILLENNRIKEFTYKFTPWPSMTKLTSREVTEENEYIKAFSVLENDGEEQDLGKYRIGKVRFEGYIFDRDAFVLRLGVSDKSGFKKYLDSNTGIRVFRDGLRVYDYGEPENDWLDLNLRRVNQPAKKLSNNIVLGAIYLDRTFSEDLIEKTNREGFVDNSAYNTFKNSITHCIDKIETLRYEDKRKIREFYGPSPKSEPVLHVLADLKEYVDKNVDKSEVKKEIVKFLVKIEDDYKRISENLLKAAGAGLSMSVVIHEVEKIIYEVQKVLKVENASERLISLVKHLSNLIDGYSEIIRKSSQTTEDIKEIIDQSLFNVEFRLLTHGVEVIKAYKDFKGVSKTQVARNLIIGSLLNIIDNSIYWLHRSGRADKKIFIALSIEEEGYLNLIIADNGTGFLLPTNSITEPFVTGKPGGIGLGLHIAYEIMQAQSGKLSFPDWGDFDVPSEFKNGALIAFGFKN